MNENSIYFTKIVNTMVNIKEVYLLPKYNSVYSGLNSNG